jgi:hypothetical protein
MPNVKITDLPAAQPLTGTEIVPMVQGGITVRATTAAIAASPSLTQTFLTLNQEPTLPNSRALTVGSGLGLTDAGALSTLQITLNGASGSLEVAGNGLVAKTSLGTVAARSIQSSGAGISVANGDGVSGNPTISLSGLAQSVANYSGTGFLVAQGGGNVGGAIVSGTTNQIDVADSSGVLGGPIISISSDPILPGTGSFTVPKGTTAQRPVGIDGMIRYNSEDQLFELYTTGSWKNISTGGIALINTGTGLTGGPITTSGTISIDSTVVTLTGTQTLTNKTISGANNTLSNIGNASLTNSSVTIGTTSLSLGGTALTLGGLTSVAVTQDPTSALQLATKQYVDAVAEGLHIHASCSAATTGTLASITGGSVTYNNGTAGVGATLTLGVALTTLDGYTLQNGNRILVKNEATQANNGIYTWATGGTVLTRATDFDTPTEIASGDFTFISNGTLYGGTGWVQTNEVLIVGTDPVVWTQFSGAGTYTAGSGLTLTGNQFSLNDPVNAALNGTVGATTPNTGAFTTISASGVATFSAGTVSAPAITTTGDTNTGIFFPAADTIAFTEGGVEAMRIDSSGFVGIGTAAPSYQLDVRNAAGGATISVQASTGNAALRAISPASGSAQLQLVSSPGSQSIVGGVGSVNNIVFNVNSVERMRLHNSGGVSIGDTTDPGAGSLRVAGNATLGDASTDTVTVNGYMGVGVAPNSGIGVLISNTALTGTTQRGMVSNFTATSSATSVVAGFQSSPGTAAASFTVADVIGVRAANVTKGAGSTITNQHGVYIDEQNQGTNNYGLTMLVSSGANKYNIYASGTAQNYFAGDVGIGTTSPANRLDIVNSASSAQMSIAGSDGQFAGMFGGTGSNGPGIFFLNTAPALRFGTGTAKSLGTFTELMRLTNGGSLGIGTASPAYRLDVNAGVADFAARILNGGVSFSRQGLLLQGGNNTEFYGLSTRTADASCEFGFRIQAGSLPAVWSTTNHSIIFGNNNTERMRLDTSGNFAIGETSAQGYRLNVKIANTSTTLLDGDALRLASSASGADVNINFTDGVANNAFIGMVSGNLYFYTNLAERMRLDTSGNLGVGITSPAQRLDVLGSGQFRPAATQDAVLISGRAGGTSSYAATITPTTLTANRTITLPDATTTVVGTDATQTLTNKRVNPRAVAAGATSGNLTPNGDTTDVFNAFGLTGAITMLAPSGTPVDGQRLMLRFEDNGTGRGITWTTTSGAFRAVGITLPTTTVASKVTYVGCVYNSTDVFWDVVATVTQA